MFSAEGGPALRAARQGKARLLHIRSHRISPSASSCGLLSLERTSNLRGGRAGDVSIGYFEAIRHRYRPVAMSRANITDQLSGRARRHAVTKFACARAG